MKRLREMLYPHRRYLKWLRPPTRWIVRALPRDGYFAALSMRAIRWVNLLTRDPDEILVASLSGSQVKMALNLSDDLQADIYYKGVYQVEILNQLATRLAPGHAFVDVGANVGFYTLWAAEYLSKHGPAFRPTTFAFEPDPDLFQCLEKNVALNHLDSCVIANPLAVSDHNSTASFYRSAHGNSGNGSLAVLDNRRLHFQTGQVVRVQTTTLDDYFVRLQHPPIGLIKLDIEGAELLALRGAQHLLDEQRPALIVEACPAWMTSFNYTFADLRAFLEQHAYTIQLIEFSGTHPCPTLTELPDGSYDLLCLPA